MKLTSITIFVSILLLFLNVSLSEEKEEVSEIHIRPIPMPPDARFAITGGYSLDWINGGWKNYQDEGSSINFGIRFSVPKWILSYKLGFSYTKLKGVGDNPAMNLINLVSGLDFVPFHRYRFTPLLGIELCLCFLFRDGWEFRSVSDLAFDGGFEFFPMKDRISFIPSILWHYNTMTPYDGNGNEIKDFEGLKYIEVRFALNYYIF
ncbi:MAG: hypothetical protein ACUVWP_05390 [bacterium]